MASMVAVPAWCLSRWRLMILRLRLLERKNRSGIAPTHGISPSSQSTVIFPAIRVKCHFDMPRLRDSQAW